MGYWEQKWFAWMIAASISFLIYAKKSDDFSKIFIHMLIWWFFPLVYITFICVALYDRKNWRWLNKKWFMVVSQKFFTLMRYGSIIKK